MQQQMTARQIINLIIGLIMVILVGVCLFQLASWGYQILTFIVPALLIATAIIDHKVLVRYVQWIGGLFKDNILWGLAMILITVVAYPIVAGGLFAQAIFFRWLRHRFKDTPWAEAFENVRRQQEQHGQEAEEPAIPEIGEYIEFEEVKEEQSRQQKKGKAANEYDQFFEK